MKSSSIRLLWPFLLAGLLWLGSPGLPAQERPDRRPPPPPRSKGPERREAPLMTVFDVNRDGELSEQEIQAVPLRLRLMDADADGTVTRSEILAGLPERGDLTEFDPVAFMKRVLKQDANRDGRLTAKELSPGLKPLLDQGDTNRDGALSRAELEAHLRLWQQRLHGKAPQKSPS